MITQLELTNFSAFDHLKIDFSKRINILVGKNGTGKTKLLKAAYAVASGGRVLRDKPKTTHDELQAFLSDRIVRLFVPLDRRLGALVHTDPSADLGGNGAGASAAAQIQAVMGSGEQVTIGFRRDSEAIALPSDIDHQRYRANPVYIPTKEIISFMEGFNSLYERYNLSFDQTYQDMYVLLELPKLRRENRHPVATQVMEQIESVLRRAVYFSWWR